MAPEPAKAELTTTEQAIEATSACSRLLNECDWKQKISFPMTIEQAIEIARAQINALDECDRKLTIALLSGASDSGLLAIAISLTSRLLTLTPRSERTLTDASPVHLRFL